MKLGEVKIKFAERKIKNPDQEKVIMPGIILEQREENGQTIVTIIGPSDHMNLNGILGDLKDAIEDYGGSYDNTPYEYEYGHTDIDISKLPDLSGLRKTLEIWGKRHSFLKQQTNDKRTI